MERFSGMFSHSLQDGLASGRSWSTTYRRLARTASAATAALPVQTLEDVQTALFLGRSMRDMQ